ncbi:protein kinase [Myxococcaceae bacterium GXIMD 01537]
MASPCQHCGSTDGPDHLCAGASLALLGQVLDGRYKIDSVLGQGGMGMVFRATQTSVQRPVAVKTLNPALAAAPTFFERFKREAELASRLRHPNIITIFDFGRAPDGTCYYVMELLQGDSLKELVKREGPQSIRRAVNLIEQATRGLAHAHAENCVHRDLKPHNIMVQQLDGKDFVKVLDFGLVKAMEQEEEEQLTSTGQVLGTPQYMPPEQAGGEVVDQRSDLYSMAGVLYFCLTGNSPYGANTVRKALTASLTQQVPPVASRRQGAPVPPAMDAFLQKALSREKEDRHQTADEFIEAMLDAIADCTPEELDALPTLPVGGSAGSGSRPSANSNRANRSPSQSGVRSRPSSPSQASPRGSASNVIVAKGGSQPSSASAARPRPRTDQPSQPSHPSQASQRSKRPAPLPPPEPEEAETAGMSTGTKAALVGIPLLLLVAGGGFVMMKSGSKDPVTPPPTKVVEIPAERPVANTRPTTTTTPPPDAPALSARVKVAVRSTPDGAAIFKDGAQLGTTPTELMLSRDQVHTLTFKLAEHKDVERMLDLSSVADGTQTIEVTLESARKAQPTRPVKQPKQPTNNQPDITVFE